MGLALTAAELTYQQSTPAPGEVDPEVLERCRGGDRLALRVLVTHYQRPVFAFLSRMIGAGPQVEDLAQEVFLRAFRALPRYEPREGARTSTWLLKIAVHLVLDERKRRQPKLVPLTEHIAADGPTPESARQRREIVEAFERAAAQLPDEQRVVFVLAQFHGLSMAQIAETVGAPEATVKTRLFRARSRLRELMSATQEIDRS